MTAQMSGFQLCQTRSASSCISPATTSGTGPNTSGIAFDNSMSRRTFHLDTPPMMGDLYDASDPHLSRRECAQSSKACSQTDPCGQGSAALSKLQQSQRDAIMASARETWLVPSTRVSASWQMSAAKGISPWSIAVAESSMQRSIIVVSMADRSPSNPFDFAIIQLAQ